MAKFTVEEINFICVFKDSTRLELIENIEQVLEHIEDKEMEVLAVQIINKLQIMGDKAFQELRIEPAEDYKEPLFF